MGVVSKRRECEKKWHASASSLPLVLLALIFSLPSSRSHLLNPDVRWSASVLLDKARTGYGTWRAPSLDNVLLDADALPSSLPHLGRLRFQFFDTPLAAAHNAAGPKLSMKLDMTNSLRKHAAAAQTMGMPRAHAPRMLLSMISMLLCAAAACMLRLAPTARDPSCRQTAPSLGSSTYYHVDTSAAVPSPFA